MLHEKKKSCLQLINVLFLTFDNKFSEIKYSLFGGRQNIFLTIFSTCRKMCSKIFENRLTGTDFMPKINFE